MKILVTGGAGFIGSHTVVELLEAGYEVVVIDNFSNSKPEVLEKIKIITNKNFAFYEGDVCDKQILQQIFTDHQIDATIHFAGLKAVGESVIKPVEYYSNNLISTLHLLEVMREFDSKRIVFSSSATVYGDPHTLPIDESFPLSTTNPYGTTKLFTERILEDVYASDTSWGMAILRYFNPIGAHASGLIGENPNDIPNNLMPYILKVATGELPELNVFGNDYDTADGTGVRDYIHVVDLAKGHLKAIEFVINNQKIDHFNLGTGIGYSVFDLVTAVEKINNLSIPYKIIGRRPGDIAACYANPAHAKEVLNWETELGIEAMCKDAYNFVMQNKKS